VWLKVERVGFEMSRVTKHRLKFQAPVTAVGIFVILTAVLLSTGACSSGAATTASVATVNDSTTIAAAATQSSTTSLSVAGSATSAAPSSSTSASSANTASGSTTSSNATTTTKRPATTTTHRTTTTAAKPTTTSTASGGVPALPDGAELQVITPAGKAVPFTLKQLAALPLAHETLEGKIQEGPLLLDVLHSAGVDSFSKVVLTGSKGPTFVNTVSASQVDGTFILDFTNHGTVKVASPAFELATGNAKDIYLIQVF
jgi:hypothetical protein